MATLNLGTQEVITTAIKQEDEIKGHRNWNKRSNIISVYRYMVVVVIVQSLIHYRYMEFFKRYQRKNAYNTQKSSKNLFVQYKQL